jgi:hypothetical protein
MNLTVSELIAAQIGLVGCLCLPARGRPTAYRIPLVAKAAAG